MKVSYLGQPLEVGKQAGVWLEGMLRDTHMTQLHIGVAWMKRSGLLRIRAELVEFKKRGGIAKVVVGIDEGGATKQGLELALELFDETYIFHDSSSRTFHPKVYLVEGESKSSLLIGSSNLTAGGLYANYEASLICNCETGPPTDKELVGQIHEWFDVIHSDSNVCKLLDDDLLKSLIAEPKYRIGDEDQRRNETSGNEDGDSITTDRIGESIFGRSSLAKAKTPQVLRVGIQRSPKLNQPRVSTKADVAESPTDNPKPLIAVEALSWCKKLSASDAQQPRTSASNATGNLKLTQAGFDIDQTTHFRQEFFGDASWAIQTTKNKVKEEAIISFEVEIEGQSLGLFNLKIDHAEHRVSNQGNVSTWLHWGSLQSELTATNYTGAWVSIERDTQGNFRLSITRTAP